MSEVASGDTIHILVATFGGAVIGLERQWSGHATGPNARFAGVRTFTLIGGLSGIAGWLCASGLMPVALVLLGGLMGLIVAAYARASSRDVDGTTEAAAIVTSAAGVLAGLGYLALASGTIASRPVLFRAELCWIRRAPNRRTASGVCAGGAAWRAGVVHQRHD